MNAPLEAILADLRWRLTALYGPRLERVILFGSQARGDSGPDSDIDVMVVLKDRPDRRVEKDRTMTLAAELSLKYATVIMPFVTDARTYTASDYSLYENVRHEGVAV